MIFQMDDIEARVILAIVYQLHEIKKHKTVSRRAICCIFCSVRYVSVFPRKKRKNQTRNSKKKLSAVGTNVPFLIRGLPLLFLLNGR